jgi:hypothetical protein
MADLPDVHCWVKVLDATDKVVPDGGSIVPQWNAVVRYIVANDSNKPPGPLTVVGSLFSNGLRVQPGGQPNVVPAQTITVQPNQIWKIDQPVSEFEPGTVYVARILGDSRELCERGGRNQQQRPKHVHLRPLHRVKRPIIYTLGACSDAR